MKIALALLLLLIYTTTLAAIPATPVMTLYQFNGKTDIPYYEIDNFLGSRKPKPAGTLAQGSALTPCLVIRGGKPVTDSKGTPYVGITLVLDAHKATPESGRHYSATVEQRRSLRVRNHHCGPDVRHVINARKLFAKKKPPFFDPPAPKGSSSPAKKGARELDTIVRAFHNSPRCAAANRSLTGRRGALERAWSAFIRNQEGRWPAQSLQRARHLDYTLRTTLYEGHLGRGCSAYGACERNTIALSIRNRARGSCLKYQGCRFPGDFEGVASKVSQYNIWDEYLTQISGLTACYLRDDLGSAQHPERGAYYDKLKMMYAQSQPDVERILFGDDRELQALFPDNRLGDLKLLRHYYHAPAMGKCFPEHQRVEYISAAVARKGDDYALIANTRIRADQPAEGGYRFRMFEVDANGDRDEIEIVDRYPGFVIDGRKIQLKTPSRCYANGIPVGCGPQENGRYRRTPPWLTAGRPLALKCRIRDSGNQCNDSPTTQEAEVGGICDIEMRPVAGVK